MHGTALYAPAAVDAGGGSGQNRILLLKGQNRVILLQHRQGIAVQGQSHHGAAHQNFSRVSPVAAAELNDLLNGRTQGDNHVFRLHDRGAVNRNALGDQGHPGFEIS